MPRIIGELAKKALLSEVWATPKPGLVDRENNGAHDDMDLAMFEASAAALEEYFVKCAQAGAEYAENPGNKEALKDRQTLRGMAAALRSAGLAGERSMYAATGGVNTHKGAVFSVGILCAAAAMGPGSLGELQHNCMAIAQVLLEEEPDSNVMTHGRQVKKATGTGGIRKEALSGFDSAFSCGLPAITEALEKGLNFNDSLVYALLKIMENTQDSNLVYRGGMEGMVFAQQTARRLTAGGPVAMDPERVREADREFTGKNLSPGGSADMLAFSAMVYFLRKEARIND